ncbi:GSCFA domain-containing protein [Maribacter thermophilus]|uniref:GSCFA domain-containing protein n=1 Tax=Maribacter thermophilus TaxID=1197874 RepID=UPI00064152E0|nr:GSCFA domain-containing protein [Maribacter thermophilus]
MKLQTQVPLLKSEHQIDYASRILLLGSCFSENVGNKLSYHQFQMEQNPFGILFHPMSIQNLILKAIEGYTYTKADIFYLNEQWHCFDAHSHVSAVTEEELLNSLNQAIELTGKWLRQGSHIIITLGTAWVYEDIKKGKVVANCHKVPQKQFQKKLLSIADITRSLQSITSAILDINPTANFVFTVSPVRHLKDGFVENQRSKAHLISAVHEVVEKSNNSQYFPSYEIMMDELRDYRFYAQDMVHPNELAIDYIWKKFQYVWISDTAEETMAKVAEVERGLRHRPFNPDSEAHKKFQKVLDQKIAYLKSEYPFMNFDNRSL